MATTLDRQLVGPRKLNAAPGALAEEARGSGRPPHRTRRARDFKLLNTPPPYYPRTHGMQAHARCGTLFCRYLTQADEAKSAWESGVDCYLDLGRAGHGPGDDEQEGRRSP